ncbi:MAG: DEAD/DEAH box helicase [Candidatus Aenigmatarchaeota archaeon]
MLLEKLPLPQKLIALLKQGGIEQLNPPQVAAIKKGLLEGKNMVISSPTASGKTLIAEMAILKNYLEGKKSVYLVPLKALASEKYEDFSKYKKIGMRVGVSTGDLDSSDGWLGSYDLIILSNEKMDSLLRHGIPWAKDIALIVSDEIHLIDDPMRGPTLEVVLTQLAGITRAQIIALSATIENAKEIAEWLDAQLVKSDYRPVKLHKGVMYSDDESYKIEFSGRKSTLPLGAEIDTAICLDTIQKEKQALMFVSTRRSAETVAEKLSKEIKKVLSVGEREKLKKLANEIESVLGNPTKQCRRLARIVEGGTAFHHAGLVSKQRKLIEDAFRSGSLKVLAATSTLAFGLNLPAYRVVIRDTKRFTQGYGATYLPVIEIHQMQGRAGRPKYDTEGEAILLAKSKSEAKSLWERYIAGDAEPIYSKLGVERVLRIYILSLISSGYVKTRGELETFFMRTFFAKQYGDINSIVGKIERIITELENYKFIIVGNKGEFISKEFMPAFQLTQDVELHATKLGKRVSELYLDPVSANLILGLMTEDDTPTQSLMMICQCSEMHPLLSVKKKEYEDIEDELSKSDIEAPDVWDVEYEDFLSEFKTALLIREWTSESGEDVILEKYGVTPGELYNKTTNAEWLLYSASELAMLLGIREIANNINKVRLQVKHGVKEELLKLVTLKGIGRARARKLFNAGIRTPVDIKKADEIVLAKLLGPKIAKEIRQSTEQ